MRYVMLYCKELPALAVWLKALMPERRGLLRLTFAKKLSKLLDAHRLKEAMLLCQSVRLLCKSVSLCLF